MLPYGVERTGSGISNGFRSMCGTNALERVKRYRIETSLNPGGRIETSLNPGGRNVKKDRDPT